MKVLAATSVLLFLFCISSNCFSGASAISISANLSPSNASLVALLPGENNYTFECDIFESSELLQITTAWTLQKYGSSEDDQKLVFQFSFEDIFLIQGTSQTSGSASATFRNRLVLVNFTEELDRSILRCRSQSGDTEEPGYFQLRMYRAPQLLQSHTVNLVEGTSGMINLNETSEAFPFPQDYQWRRNGAEAVNSSTVVLGYPAISFFSILRSDSANYILTATNYRLDYPEQKLGTEVGSIQINVLYGPDFVEGPSVVTAALGTSTKLICGENLVSNPEPVISWTDNHGVAVNPAGIRFSQDDDPSLLSLTVAGLATDDEGLWLCTVTVENVGMAEHNVNLIVVGPPSSPKDVQVISSTATSIQLSWEEPMTLGTPSSADTLYSIAATNQVDLTTQHTGLQGMTTGTITGLLPNTLYSLTVTAWSSAGRIKVPGSPSSSKTQVTETTVPDIECNSAPISTNGIITISWHFVHTGGLDLSQVSVLSSTHPSKPWDFQPLPSQLMAVDETGRPTSVTASQLPAGSTYVFMVRAFNMQGNSSATCPPITHDIGIPQAPVITGASSGNGQVMLEVLTRESGTYLLNFFQFNVRVENRTTLNDVKFTLEKYMDGEKALLVVGPFEKSEMVEDTYRFFVSCTNDFGMSGESDPFEVAVKFSSPLTAIATSGIAAGAGVILVLMAVLVAMFCVYLQRRYNRKKATLKINPVNNLAHSRANDMSDSSMMAICTAPALPSRSHVAKQIRYHPSISPHITPLPSQQKGYMHSRDSFSAASQTDGIYDRLPSAVDFTSSLAGHAGHGKQHSIILGLEEREDSCSSSRDSPYAETQSEEGHYSELAPNNRALPAHRNISKPDSVTISQFESMFIDREIVKLEAKFSGTINQTILSADKSAVEEDYDTLEPKLSVFLPPR